MSHIIRSCSWDAETGGLVLEFLTPAQDVRDNGMVLNHALLVPPEDQHLDLLKSVDDALQAALVAALASFEEANGIVLPDEGDDGPAPFDNPEER